MTKKLQIKRGNKSDLPMLASGEFGLCEDTNELYIGTPQGNLPVVHPGGTGDMMKSVYDTDGDGSVDQADTVRNAHIGGALYFHATNDYDNPNKPLHLWGTSDMPAHNFLYDVNELNVRSAELLRLRDLNGALMNGAGLYVQYKNGYYQLILHDADTSPAYVSVDKANNAENASKVSGHTVAANVPANAKFTDTVYTHPSSGVTAGTYRSVTVNAQGHVTGGTKPTTLSGYGITDAVPATRTVAGKALSANITLTKSDVGLGNVNNAAALPLAGGTMAGAINMNNKRLQNINPTMTFANNTGGIEVSSAGNRFYMGNGWYNFYGNDNTTFGTVAAQISNQSSRTVKKNIAALDAQAAQKVLQLRPVEFDYKQDGKHSLGFLAQEVLELFPEVVSMQDKNNEDTWGLYETRLIAPLVKLCQEQQAQMDAQQALLEKLQVQMAVLQKQVDPACG